MIYFRANTPLRQASSRRIALFLFRVLCVPMRIIKTRFAPSHTGLLHFGNVRTALFNALLARKERGTFLLRIEDTDQERSRPEYTRALEEDLRWLGLPWAEGPGAGGEAGPYFQSERQAVYERYLGHLEAEAHVYPCFCSAVELEISRKVQAASGRPPRYSGKCAHLKPDEVARKRAQGLPFTYRYRMPRGEMVVFEDLVRGRQTYATDDIGDFIVRRSDGTFAFFFVNALDDALMGVTHVLRGEDHLANTPRQIALLSALKLPVPVYGHISLIVDGHGAPLSKRSGSLSVQELRELGYFPAAVNNYLARLGHAYAQTELLDFDHLAGAFDLSSLGRAPGRYDRAQLDHWQAQAVLHADLDTLCEWLAPALSEHVPAAQMRQFADAIRDNVLFPQEAGRWAQAVFSERLPLSSEARAVLEETSPEFFRHAAQALTRELDFAVLASRVKSATGFKGKALFLPLRAALTGQVSGPELPRLLPLIGFERAHHRLSEHLLSTQID